MNGSHRTAKFTDLTVASIREEYANKSEHFGGGFGKEVRFLLTQIDRIQKALDDALERQCVEAERLNQ